MELTIRQASEEDLDKMEEFYFDVTKHLENNNNYPSWESGTYPARGDAEKGVELGILFLAEDENKTIVGSFILTDWQIEQYDKVKWQIEVNNGEMFIIHTFCVSPKFAKKGIGLEMLKWIEGYAKYVGIKTIRLDAYEVNPPAIALYEKYGFTYMDTISIGLEHIGLDWFRIYEKVVM